MPSGARPQLALLMAALLLPLRRLPEGAAKPSSQLGLRENLSDGMEYGQCTTTCGIGNREILKMEDCPGSEPKCLVRVEECRGPEDCGWGKPIYETLNSVKLTCVFISPENRFTYSWKKLIKDKQPIPVPNEVNILEVKRENNPVVYQCDTLENNQLIATIKYIVFTQTEIEFRSLHNSDSGPDIVLVVVLTVGALACIGVIVGIFLLILLWKSKNMRPVPREQARYKIERQKSSSAPPAGHHREDYY